MERIKVTPEQVLDVMREVVAEAGEEFVYEPPTGLGVCLYVHRPHGGGASVPGCLVGQVLHRLGVPLDELTEHEAQLARTMAPKLVDAGEGADLLVTALDNAQAIQDGGHSWGAALRAAEEVLSA
ncbi:hypothetical protein ACH4OV_25305 [Streptomyces diastaticus]|uniref:hypothetical protein n=1 Tax=Streptomyces diastaticus TaxID=1956 RepID=UPI0037B519FD